MVKFSLREPALKRESPKTFFACSRVLVERSLMAVGGAVIFRAFRTPLAAVVACERDLSSNFRESKSGDKVCGTSKRSSPRGLPDSKPN